MFIIKLLSQHVLGIIMPIIRRTRVYTAAYGVLHWLWWLWLCGAGTRAVHCESYNQARTPYVAVHNLVLLMMGIIMPETCWNKSLIINIGLVASCWFLSLHPTFMMHGHTSLKVSQFIYFCKTLYIFQTGFPSITRGSKLHIQRQVFVGPLLLPAASRPG